MGQMSELYDEGYERERADEPAHHTCRKCGKTGLWWDYAPGQLVERVLWEERPRGHNGPHQCEFTSHFEDET